MADIVAPHACVRVDLACNDDAGRFTGFAQAMQIGRGEPLMELEAPGRGVGIGLTPGRLLIGRKAFDICGQAHWVGSMVWDGVWMSVEEAARLLLWTHDQRWFQLGTAEAGIFEMWRRPEPFRGIHLIHQLTLVGREQRGQL